MAKPIYLDYNATTPVLPEVANAMQPYLSEFFGNPSSSHSYGVQTQQAIETARQQTAGLLGCDREEIIFTSGGSESNNLAIKGIAYAYRHKGNHLITSAIEHPAVMEVCRFLETQGFEISYVPVDAYGWVDPGDIQKAIRSGTILITIMHANNEVGTIQSIAEIGAIAHHHEILLHTDAAQSVGKIPSRVDELSVDLLSVAGHKLYAPKGIGALYVRRGVQLEKLIHGAAHEHNRRAGTENVLEIVGLGKACEIAQRDLPEVTVHLKKMCDQLNDGLVAGLADQVSFRLNGHPQNRLPNTLSISFANLEANLILSEINDFLAVSAGAACHSDRVDISPTLQAMQVPAEFAMGTIRFSTGRLTTSIEIEKTIRLVSSTVKGLNPAGVKTAELSPVAEVKLTHFTQGLGCACKLRPQILEKILKRLPVPGDSRVLIGTETFDDAAVFKINDQTALVQTVDFFTPIVDDPFDFGRIAASNALSDIYAMGAQPMFALNVVAFPSQRLSVDVLEKILQGAQQIASEAGIAIIGGHTIEDNEPKYGLVVCGIVHPAQIWRNQGAKPDDTLILTKPLGTGIVTTALKKGILSAEDREAVTAIMTQLNKTAAEVLRNYTVHACTDVTGFGLLGHLYEMSSASKMDVQIIAQQVPVIPGVENLISLGLVPGGTKNNLEYVNYHVEWDLSISEAMKYILSDAQTSGGLLAAVPSADAEKIITEMHRSGLLGATRIGKFTKNGAGKIRVL